VALLGDVLSSRVRATLLAWVAPRLDTPFSLTELSRAVGSPISSLQHECYKLERLGLLKGHREGGSRRYLMQLDHAMARPLVGLTIAAAGIGPLLRESLDGAGRFGLALIAGPGPTPGESDLLLALVGESDLEGLDRAQRRVSLLLGHEQDRIELAYFHPDDWRRHGPERQRLAQRLAHRQVQSIIGEWPPDGAGHS